jgi:hypothetical protein
MYEGRKDTKMMNEKAKEKVGHLEVSVERRRHRQLLARWLATM